MKKSYEPGGIAEYVSKSQMMLRKYMPDTIPGKLGLLCARRLIHDLGSRMIMAHLRSGIVIPALLFFTIMTLGAQPSARPVEPPLVRQLNRAIGMAESGDKQQALALANALVEKYPDSVPALKLQAVLLEKS